MSADAEGNVRVLIADNSPIVRERLISLLIDLKQVNIVGQAGSLPEIVAAVPQARPDIVILDIHMPGGSGLDALKYIKQTLDRVVVIILSNYASPHYHKLFLSEGADYIFDKSREFEKVLAVIEGYVARG